MLLLSLILNIEGTIQRCDTGGFNPNIKHIL